MACGVFALYTRTLVPSVLDGDQGELQYMPSVLGIPHPSGFPLYVLIGHVWSALPVGTLAFRMNLLSAFFGALTVGGLYLALRSQKLSLPAALGASLTLALIPQFWEYSTVAAVYRLHNFLIVLLFAFLPQWERTRVWLWLELAALAFGLDLANHLTIVFVAPATALFVLLVSGRTLFKQARVILVASLLLILPLIMYLYFPLRGGQLLSRDFVLPGWNLAMAQGIVSPFFDPGPYGLFQYLVGGAFFRSVTGHWQWKWDTLVRDWEAILLDTVNWQIVALSLIGLVGLAFHRLKLAVWLALVVLTFQIIALQYSYEGLAEIGQFSSYFREYYLPSFIALVIFEAWGIEAAINAGRAALSRLGARSGMIAIGLATLTISAFVVFALADLVGHHSDSLATRSAEIESKWHDIMKYEPDPGSAMVGHWGDLTPLWYYQYSEDWRRDLVAITPPDDGLISEWLATGKPLYIAGSLLGWAPEIARNYRLTPWGQLVRVTRSDYTPTSPLSNVVDWTFGGEHPMLRLSGFDLSRTSLRVGDDVQVAAFWEVLDTFKIDDVALRLTLSADDEENNSRNFSPVVNWLPGGKLVAGQQALGEYKYAVPWGLKPGSYHLRIGLYSIAQEKNLTAATNGSSVSSVDLGTVLVEPAQSYPATASTEHPANTNFGNRIVLLGWNGDLGQLATGAQHSVDLLWKSTSQDRGNLQMTLSLENPGFSRSLGEQELARGYPSGLWQNGELVRGQVMFVVPADIPDANYTLILRVRDSSQQGFLDIYEGWLPHGASYTLSDVRVVGRAHSYQLPKIGHTQSVDYDNRIRLLGYDLPSTKLNSGDNLHITLDWQAQSLMQTSYKFFVHVIDEQGQLIAQHDSFPGANSLPTTGWLPGEIVQDSFEVLLPASTPSGLYRIEVGFYDPVSGSRLNIAGVTGSTALDHAVLDDTLEIKGQ